LQCGGEGGGRRGEGLGLKLGRQGCCENDGLKIGENICVIWRRRSGRRWRRKEIKRDETVEELEDMW